MATNYPGSLDNFTNPTSADDLDSVTVPHATQHANVNDAVEAIEGELGTNPSAAFATVAARFTAVESTASGAASAASSAASAASAASSAATAAATAADAAQDDVDALEAVVAALPGGDTRVFDAVAYGALVDGSTNDTAAWQAAIDAAGAAGGGVVTSSKNGVSVISGALQDTGGANAQLTLPSIHVPSGEQITVVLRGLTPPPTGVSVIGSITMPDNHLVLKSTLASGTGAVLAGDGPSGSTGDFTFVDLRVENVEIRTVANPTITALDLRKVAQVDLDRVLVTTGSFNVSSLAEPTSTGSYGIRLPANNNGAHVRLGMVDVVGFYTAFEFAEHATGTKVAAWGCKVAAEFDTTNHASVFLRFMAVWCERGLKFTGAHAVDVWQFDIEHAASGWMTTDYDLDDASNLGKGFLRWHSVLAGVGDHNSFTVNGGSGFTTSRVGAALGSGGGSADGIGYVYRDRLVAVAGNTILTLGATPVANSPLVWVNGALKWPTTDYTISGSVITFGSTLSASDVVAVQYHSAASTASASALSSPGLVIADNFNRADGPLGSTSTGALPWTAYSGNWGVVSNKATVIGGTGSTKIAYIESSTANCTVGVKLTPRTIPEGALDRYYGLWCRTDGAGNGIFAQVNGEGNTLTIERYTSGASTIIGAAVSYTPAVDDLLEMVMAGTSITVKVNGVTKVTATDATYQTATKHGIWQYYSTAVRFDDFSITA